MSSAPFPPTLSNDQRREQLRSAVEVECGTAISSEATDEEVEAKAREALTRLDELVRMTERPATVRRLADALYRHFADFAAGMGDPPTEHAPDYPWIHQQFVRAWERATAPSSVLGSITAPVATAVVAPADPLLTAPAASVVQAAPPPPAPAPTRISARICARSPAATDKASTKSEARASPPNRPREHRRFVLTLDTAPTAEK
ncbi:hypothetical protein VTO73DRAFT_11994 [Trametes versicolor]